MVGVTSLKVGVTLETAVETLLFADHETAREKGMREEGMLAQVCLCIHSMCEYMYIYIYIYIHTHTHTHTNTFTYICTHIYMCCV